ncbi:MAG TPA: MFS transporter [Caulobacteraceae bacterium]|nr:MFS transporter [Caulobacteraceae bacterium]
MTDAQDDPDEEHLVHEAVGPDFHPLEAAGALAVGVNGLLVLGVLPVLLGAMAQEGRLTEAGIGQAATLELLAMGISTALAGMALKPARLKLMGAVLALILAGLDIACMRAAGAPFMALRAAAGAVEGVLLWITVSMIARTVTPERWAGVFFTAQTSAQLALAIAFATFIMPRFGIEGGFASLAIVSIVGVVPALASPSVFAPLPAPPGESGVPPPRGWIALIGTFVYVSAAGAVGVYLQPLALQAHLTADVARTALWVGLAAQVAGGMSATAMAGRIGWFNVFLITTVGYLISWWLMGRTVPAGVFIGANVLAGFVGLFLGPFLVPMTIEADPSRRAAVQSGGAQVLGGALGPWLASFVVGETDVRGVLWLGAGALAVGLIIVAWLHLTARRTVTAPAAGKSS